MERETLEQMLQRLRESVVPKGTANLTYLTLANHGFVDHTVVKEAIDQLEKACTVDFYLGVGMNGLEKLGMLLLVGSLRHHSGS